jgi:hypothetical protein
MNKWTEILVGLILVIGTIVIAWFSGPGGPWTAGVVNFNFWHAGWEFLKGGVFWLVLMVGTLFVLLGISDLKG